MNDYFTHNIDLIAQARKKFRPRSTNDDTVIAEQSDYIWDPDWSHPLFLNIPIDISSQNNQYNKYSQRLCKSNSTHNRSNTFKL